MARLTLSLPPETLCTERLADGTPVTYASFPPDHPGLGKLRSAMAIVDRVAASAPADQASLTHLEGLPGGTAFARLWTHPKTRILRSPNAEAADLVVVHANRTDIAVHDGALTRCSHWEIAAALCQEMARASGPIRPRRAPRLRDWQRADMPALESTVEGLRRFFTEAYA